ncbi:MAG: hypothetical protein M5U01_30925 [Ardenticatenaceae bacterium]|nr:hypothetical protein [Ardenticatenaceae bacterium]
MSLSDRSTSYTASRWGLSGSELSYSGLLSGCKASASPRLRSIPTLNDEITTQYGVTLASLDTVLSCAEFVSIHVPLSAETEYLVGAREFGPMNPSAYLIDTARGAVVDEEALVCALQQGPIAGAALDVLTQEPPASDHPLLHLDNVIVMPYAASVSVESRQAARQDVCDAVTALLSGQWPPFVVNQMVTPRFLLAS